MLQIHIQMWIPRLNIYRLHTQMKKQQRELEIEFKFVSRPRPEPMDV